MTMIRHSSSGGGAGSRVGHGGGGSSLRGNGHHYGSKSGGSRLRWLIVSLTCYSALITLMLFHGKAADTPSSSGGGGGGGIAAAPEISNFVDSGSSEMKAMEGTIRSLRLQVEELSAKASEAEARAARAASAAAASASATAVVPTTPKYLRDERPNRVGGRGVATGATTTTSGADRSWIRSDHTLSSFEVAGVNLALYGIDDNNPNADTESKVVASSSTKALTTPYELYDDFDIGDQITGTETWSELLSLRRHQRNLNLAFYVDKVALKRYWPTVDIPIPRQYYNRYASEMPNNDAFERFGIASSVNQMIPREMSYVAKPSHLRGSHGVILIRYLNATATAAANDGGEEEEGVDADADADADADDTVGRTFLGRFDANMKEVEDGEETAWKTAKYLAKHFKERVAGGLEDDSTDDSPWSLSQVPPGLIIEERITLWDNDMRPPMQFQVFVIFGRAYIARWSRGLSPWGLVRRDGTVVDWVGKPDNHPELPDWVDWARVIEMSERVGANKDMIRVDIFVGVSAEDAEALDESASEEVRKDAVKTVASDFELVPPMLELEKDPSILEEAARLWISGYKSGNYKVVPNSEIPDEYRKTGKLSDRPWTKNWIKTKYTLSEFDSMGVNLATYKMPPSETDDIGENEEPFELYDNFNIAGMITGNENWWDLVAYRRELDTPGLNFYVDKVAQKRWLPTIGMPIPRPFLCRYLSELPQPSDNAGIPKEHITIRTMLPQESNYAAKPSHTSCSDGVWLVKYDGVTKIAAGGQTMTEADDGALEGIAKSLATSLHEDPRGMESIALKNVTHGFVVEERFTGLTADDKPAMEFKIFCFWGRVWVANWRRGGKRWGLLHRNGTVIDWAGKKRSHETLPAWVNWDRVIEIAEKMAQHKDMFRVDMFVGLPASSPALGDGVSEEEKEDAVEIVISEFEVHPTTKFIDPRLFDEASRLWIAGYKKLNIKTIHNDEIPQTFLESAEFPPPPESREWVETKHTTKDFPVAGVNLGPYRMGADDDKNRDGAKTTEEPFELFEEFDISDQITGNEAWWDLITIRIGLKDRPALPFYNDKVALRRYLPSVGVPMPKSFVLQYGVELTETGRKTDETRAITKMLPTDEDFVAKPSHSCFGDDVWLVRHHMDGDQKVVSVNGGVGRQRMKPKEDFDRAEIGKALTTTLHHPPGTYGSWIYDNIKPGIVVEERFASIDDDNKPAMEFKVFTIWGRCYIAQWRRGTYSGIVYPDGSVVEWGKMKKSSTKLPDWVDWKKVKALAEKMGQNMDMFRTDIFVGVPSSSPALKEHATDEEKWTAVQVVVSEFEMQPGTLQMDPGIFDDAARLWISGYKIGNYKVVSNNQVPAQYVEKGYLSEDDITKAQEQ